MHTLQSVSYSRRDIHKRLGRGLKFEFGLECHRCESGGNGGEYTRHYLNWSGRYVGFKEMHESIMDDHTRQRLLVAADWAETAFGSSNSDNVQKGDARSWQLLSVSFRIEGTSTGRCFMLNP